MNSYIPFHRDELFRLNETLTITLDSVEENDFSCDVIIIDNVFKNFKLLSSVYLNSPSEYFRADDRNGIDYYDCRRSIDGSRTVFLSFISKLIYTHYGVKTISNCNELISSNWFLSKTPRPSDYAAPHVDVSRSNFNRKQFSILTYLNEDGYCVGGTAFFKNNILQSCLPFNNEKNYWNVYDDRLQSSSFWLHPKYQEYWECLKIVDMKPNRMIIFPANVFHAAYIPSNIYNTFPRVTLITWMEEC